MRLLIDSRSLEFFPEWYSVEPKLRKELKSYTMLAKVSRDLGVSLADLFNLYNGRIAAFTVFQTCVDSGKDPDAALMVAGELLDIVLMHILDDIVDETPNPFISAIGEPRIIALSLAALFEVFRKNPELTEIGEYYYYDFAKVSGLDEYMSQLYARAARPIEILLKPLNPPSAFLEFWKNAYMYLKVLDDINDKDSGMLTSELYSIKEELLTECRVLAQTSRQRKFLKAVEKFDAILLEAAF